MSSWSVRGPAEENPAEMHLRIDFHEDFRQVHRGKLAVQLSSERLKPCRRIFRREGF
ncbi:MAG: hypothetical protein ABI145_19690 [Steroidobacteraceae bacterium]